MAVNENTVFEWFLYFIGLYHSYFFTLPSLAFIMRIFLSSIFCSTIGRIYFAPAVVSFLIGRSVMIQNPDKVLAECRARFLSFLGTSVKNTRL